MFSWVSTSLFCSWRGWYLKYQVLPSGGGGNAWPHVPSRGYPPHPCYAQHMYGQQAVGTHPTAMLSCFILITKFDQFSDSMLLHPMM